MEVCRLTPIAGSGKSDPYPMFPFRGLTCDLTPRKRLINFLRARQDTSIHAADRPLR